MRIIKSQNGKIINIDNLDLVIRNGGLIIAYFKSVNSTIGVYPQEDIAINEVNSIARWMANADGLESTELDYRLYEMTR